MRREQAGFGVFFRIKNKLNQAKRVVGDQQIGKAELQAIETAIKILEKTEKKEAYIITDSKYVKKAIKKCREWKEKEWMKAENYTELIRINKKIKNITEKGGSIKIIHIQPYK